MRGKIMIGNREIEMAANAASPFYYKEIFKEDFLLKAQETPPDVNIFVKMGFIMAKQAEKSFSEMMKLPAEEFFTWLDQFEPMDVLNAAGEISNLYMGQTESSSIPKNEAD